MPKRAAVHPQTPVQERHQHQGGDGEPHREQVGRVDARQHVLQHEEGRAPQDRHQHQARRGQPVNHQTA